MNRTRSGIRSTDPSSTVAHWVMDSPQELINVQVVIAQRRCHNLSTPQYFTSTHCDIIGPQVAYKQGFFSIFYFSIRVIAHHNGRHMSSGRDLRPQSALYTPDKPSIPFHPRIRLMFYVSERATELCTDTDTDIYSFIGGTCAIYL